MSHPTRDLAALFSLLSLLISLTFPEILILKSLDLYPVSGEGDHLSLSQYNVMCQNGAEHSFLGLDISLVRICPYIGLLYSSFQLLACVSASLLIACVLNILISKKDL
jgi:hypothetical protein